MPGFDLFAGWSYLGIIVFLILTGCGFPLPEEVAFVYAGVQSALGNLHWPLAIGACAVGALLGDSVMYGIGRLGRGWIGRHAWFSRVVHLEREEQVRRLIAQHGIKVFFAARFMVGIRGPLYVTLGILKVPFWRFMIIDSICASAVIAVFFSMSYFFGQRVLLWIEQGERLLTILAATAAVVGGVLWYLYAKKKKREAMAAQQQAIDQRPEPIVAVTESILGVSHEELVKDPAAADSSAAGSTEEDSADEAQESRGTRSN